MLLKRKLPAAIAAAVLTLAVGNPTGRPTEPVQIPALHAEPAVTAAPDDLQAAALRGWGPVVAGDEFSYTGAPNPRKWKVYDGPGHAGDMLEDLGHDRRYVLERLRQLPLDPFRISYAYTNFGLTAAADATERQLRHDRDGVL